MKRNKVVVIPFKYSKVFICQYCGNFAIKKYANQKYCDIEDRPCRYYAMLENNAEWKRKNYKSKKQLLGSSNLGANPQNDFKKEEHYVKKERRRLGI